MATPAYLYRNGVDPDYQRFLKIGLEYVDKRKGRPWLPTASTAIKVSFTVIFP